MQDELLNAAILLRRGSWVDPALFERAAKRMAELEEERDAVYFAGGQPPEQCRHIPLPKFVATRFVQNHEYNRLVSDSDTLWADAKRYQWLRDQRGWPLQESPGGSALDKYIDAAIAESAK